MAHAVWFAYLGMKQGSVYDWCFKYWETARPDLNRIKIVWDFGEPSAQKNLKELCLAMDFSKDYKIVSVLYM